MKSKDLFSKLEGILYNFQKTQEEINNLKLEINYIQNNYEGCGAIGYEERTGETYKFNSQVENEIIEKERMIEMINRKLRAKQHIINKVTNALNALKEREVEFIELRYIEGKGEPSWEEVAEKMGISTSRCFQLREKIIEKLIPMVFIVEKL